VLSGLLITAATVVVVGLLLMVTDRFAGDRHTADHDVAGAIFSMIGVLYAVLLAFVVIVVWEASSSTHDHTQSEANDVSQIYFTARALPQPQRTQLTRLAADYASTVAYQEWPAMQRGQTSAKARADIAGMRTTVMALQPVDNRQQILMSQTLDAINALVDARRQRTGAVQPPVPPIMWFALIAGAAITVGFTFFFSYGRLVPQLVMVSAMTAMLAFTLWLTYEMSYPFSGPTGRGPDAFLEILSRFKEFS
jgi:hypothetical protein